MSCVFVYEIDENKIVVMPSAFIPTCARYYRTTIYSTAQIQHHTLKPTCNCTRLNTCLNVGLVPISIASLQPIIGGMKTCDLNGNHT